MTRAGALVLILTNCFLFTHAADLKCSDIRAIVSGYLDCNILDRPCSYSKANLIEPWWNYGPDRTYKNRHCDKCELDQESQDCKDNSCTHMSGPAGTAIDLLPADSESWICPGFCASMPQIPIKFSLIKKTSTWYCANYWNWPTNTGACLKGDTRVDYEPVVVNQLPMSTPFKTSYTESTDAYAVRPISECKTKRYEDNWNARVNACWQWSSLSSMPQMAHLDVFWTDGAARAHTFDGVKEKTQTISQCRSIDNTQPYFFQSEPCWMGSVVDQQKKRQFSIKPYYTYYRGKESKSATSDCRMRVVGVNNPQSNKWDDSALLPPSSTEWNINSHWHSPPTRTNHFYYFKTVFDAMQNTFGQFSQKQDKTIATWDFTIPCVDHNNNPQRSTKVYYAESGCSQQTCVDFISKPCYDNIYRFDEMVCTLIERLGSNPIKFSQFKDKIMSGPQKEPFMSYGNSHFEIWYDNAKVQVRKDTSITVIPNQPVVFTDDSTIFVSLIRDGSMAYSCDTCFDRDLPLFGRFSLTDTAMANDIIKCRPCIAHEYIKVTASSRNYQDCVACPKHQVRNSNDRTECRKCLEIDALTPMRRAAPHPQTDAQCTTCQHFQYFDENTAQGCEFLKTVTDGIVVTNNKAVLSALSGKDYYIKDENRKEIDAQFYRDKILTTTPWNRELVPQACSPGYNEPVTLVKRLKFTAWCAHQEMVRHQQAWLQVDGSSLYVPLNSDQARTRSNTSVVELCGGNALTQVRGSTTADLQCGSYKFLIIRSGFQDPCTLCLGAKFTQNCWPTYVPGLEVYDEQYFLRGNAALTPQPGTCGTCKPVCDKYLEPDHYIDPVEYSCWWNGIGRIPGVLGSTATNFSWYKQAPCTKCNNVQIAADTAELVLACGNRVSYRRWLADTVTGSEDDPTRSIPSIQVCCVQPAGLCTSTPAEFETFALQKCTQTVEDTTPAFLPYCPPFWYVNPACAKESPLWNPDCCVKCKSCRGGKFKTDAYYDCPGDQYFDSQDRGCTTSCLTNQYLRNERCIKCEACE